MSDKLNLFQKMIKASQEIGTLGKNKNVAGKYDALTHDKVTDVVSNKLIELGILAYATVVGVPVVTACEIQTRSGPKPQYRADILAKVTFVNAEDPSQTLEVMAFGSGFDDSDKAPGKAYSYAVKYAYLKALMLPTGDKDEDRPEILSEEEKKAVEEAEKKRLETEAKQKKQAAEKYAETIEGVLMTGDVMNVVASKDDQSWIERLCRSYPDVGKGLLNKVSKATKAKLDQSPDSEVAAFLNSASGDWLGGIVKHYLPDVYQEFEMEVASRVQKEAA